MAVTAALSQVPRVAMRESDRGSNGPSEDGKSFWQRNLLLPPRSLLNQDVLEAAKHQNTVMVMMMMMMMMMVMMITETL
jgi:hypothetical protein